jgi:hypothetical protein
MKKPYKCKCGKTIGTFEEHSVVIDFETKCSRCKRIIMININVDQKPESRVLERPEVRVQSHLVTYTS